MQSSPQSEPLERRRFQILALSGGGFRGLYTAKIIADIEQSTGKHFASHFDLLSGTSIGGIIALALALEIPALEILRFFEQHGNDIFKRRWSLFGILRAPYTADQLKALLQTDKWFGNRTLSACRHRVIVPSISYTTGEPVLFKTPHSTKFRRDHRAPLVDIALATSAAPSFFPRHRFDNNQYVDGGLVANAPGLLALHEATEFLDVDRSNVHMVSIGTMSSKFTVDPRRNANGGAFDWGGGSPVNMPKRLFGLSISVQESLSAKMLGHILGDRYLHVDDDLADERGRAVKLDSTDAPAREILLGTAGQRAKSSLGDPKFQTFLEHSPPEAVFFHGENSTGDKQC